DTLCELRIFLRLRLRLSLYWQFFENPIHWKVESLNHRRREILRACRVKVSHFRGVKYATIMLPHHVVLIGDNNTGKTTILESLDLALGPDRLNRTPPIDEHDFYQGRYLAKPTPETPPEGED